MNLLYKIHKNEYNQQKENVVRSVFFEVDRPRCTHWCTDVRLQKRKWISLGLLNEKKNQRNSNETNKNLGAAMNKQCHKVG